MGQFRIATFSIEITYFYIIILSHTILAIMSHNDCDDKTIKYNFVRVCSAYPSLKRSANPFHNFSSQDFDITPEAVLSTFPQSMSYNSEIQSYKLPILPGNPQSIRANPPQSQSPIMQAIGRGPTQMYQPPAYATNFGYPQSYQQPGIPNNFGLPQNNQQLGYPNSFGSPQINQQQQPNNFWLSQNNPQQGNPNFEFPQNSPQYFPQNFQNGPSQFQPLPTFQSQRLSEKQPSNDPYNLHNVLAWLGNIDTMPMDPLTRSRRVDKIKWEVENFVRRECCADKGCPFPEAYINLDKRINMCRRR